MLTNEYGRTPTEVEIATHMGISGQRLAELEDAFQDSISLTAPIFNADGEASNTLMEVFEDRKVDVERDVYAKLLHTELMEIIDKYLTDMQKFIILNRFGFEEEKLSLQKIGDMYGVSKQYIEQTQKKALSKIRRVAGSRLKDFLG